MKSLATGLRGASLRRCSRHLAGIWIWDERAWRARRRKPARTPSLARYERDELVGAHARAHAGEFDGLPDPAPDTWWFCCTRRISVRVRPSDATSHGSRPSRDIRAVTTARYYQTVGGAVLSTKKMIRGGRWQYASPRALIKSMFNWR